MKVLFLDTNILLHCKDLKELPWKDIQSKDSLLLIISRPVQKEVDRLKNDGNSKRAKKARNVTKILREIVFSVDSKTNIRPSNPSVDISIVPRLRGTNEIPDTLDMSSADDQILAEMIAYIEKNPDDEVALLTQDINLLTTAKNLDLPFHPIPDDWLLPVPPDQRDKEIKNLKEHLKGLQSSFPKVEIEVMNNERDIIDSLSIEVLSYKELEVAELKELVEIIKDKNPIQTVFDDIEMRKLARSNSAVSRTMGITYEYEPPNQEVVEKYQNEEYPSWLKRVEDFIESLPYKLGLPFRSANIYFSVNNIGSIPVEDMLVEFNSYGGLLFNPPGHRDYQVQKETINKLLQPPEPPEGRIIENSNSTFAALQRSIPDFSDRFIDTIYPNPWSSLYNAGITPRGKNKFYWKDGKPDDYVDDFAFECAEFLHHTRPEEFNISVFVPMDKKDRDKFTIRCRVVGRNLPEPIICSLPVTVRLKNLDSFEKVKSLIQL